MAPSLVSVRSLLFLFVAATAFRLLVNHAPYGTGDAFEAYLWGRELYYYSHARFFSHLPGPWQNLLSFALIELFHTEKALAHFTGTLGVLATLLTYLVTLSFAKEFPPLSSATQEKIAFLAGLFTAALPCFVRFSSYFVNHNFLLPLAVSALYLSYKTLTTPNTAWIALLLPLLTLMPFFHGMAFFLIPAVFTCFFLPPFRKVNFNGRMIPLWRSLNAPALGLGLGLSALLIAPFVWMDYRNGFYILRAYLFTENHSFRFHPEAFRFLSDSLLVMTSEIFPLLGDSFSAYRNFLTHYFYHPLVFFLLALPSYLLSLLLNLRFFCRRQENRALYFLKAYVLLNGFFYFITFQPHFFRYSLLYMPALAIILAYETVTFLRRWTFSQLRWRRYFWGYVAYVLLLSGALFLALQNHYEKRGAERSFQQTSKVETLKFFLLKDHFSSLSQASSNQPPSRSQLYALMHRVSRESQAKSHLPLAHSFYSVFPQLLHSISNLAPPLQSSLPEQKLSAYQAQLLFPKHTYFLENDPTLYHYYKRINFNTGLLTTNLAAAHWRLKIIEKAQRQLYPDWQRIGAFKHHFLIKKKRLPQELP